MVRSGLRMAGMKVRKAIIGAAQIKCRRSRPMLALAFLLAAALLGDPTSAQDETVGTDTDRQDASQSVIRLGMPADFLEHNCRKTHLPSTFLDRFF
jgi:hypothetical protein